MSKKTAWLIFIIDKSGSMGTIASNMEEAIEKTIRDQKKNYDGDTKVTVILFDDEYEVVSKNVPIEEIGHISLVPRGLTHLLDAMGKTINTIEAEYNSVGEEKPERVLFVIVTDGGENAPKPEFSRHQVIEMVKTTEKAYEWGFTYIGANQDAIAEGERLGVANGASLNYQANANGVRKMSDSMTSYVAQFMSTGKAEYNG